MLALMFYMIKNSKFISVAIFKFVSIKGNYSDI
jgi:hypothetical protein